VKVLAVHNHYRHAGGEDAVFRAEVELLRQNRHEVIEYTNHNDALSDLSRVQAAARTIWSRKSVQDLSQLIRRHTPDIAHFHNVFPLISPSAYHACRRLGVPVVQTLHNFRLLCPSATLFRDGHVCHDCVGRAVPWPGIVHGCYRGSRAQSAVVAGMLVLHRGIGTWRNQIDVYIALSQYAMDTFVRAGFPAAKFVIKPNFVSPDPGRGDGSGGYALFVGRLTPEKGVRTLLLAWERLGHIPLKIVGDGPLLRETVARVQERRLKVEVLGVRPHAQVIGLMTGAYCLVFPSEWYEGFPMAILEAYACGVPVVASRLGTMAEVVHDNRTGLLFAAAKPEDLASQVEELWRRPDLRRQLGGLAREEFESRYTDRSNHEALMRIYHQARECKAAWKA